MVPEFGDSGVWRFRCVWAPWGFGGFRGLPGALRSFRELKGVEGCGVQVSAVLRVDEGFVLKGASAVLGSGQRGFLVDVFSCS